MMTKRTGASAVLLSLLGVGCGEPLKDAQRIEEPRVLAVQIEGTSGTATPGPGQEATVRFLFAGPNGPEPMRLAYQVCEGADSARGVPFCAGQVLAEGNTEGASTVPEIVTLVPETAEPGGRLVVLGVACASGEPTLAADPLDWSCSGGEKPLRLSFDAYVGGKDANRNPDLSALEVEISGEPLTLSAPDVEPTCEEGVHGVQSGSSQTLSVSLGALSREADEWLQVSHFSTRGKFERQYTVIEPGEEPRAVVEWKVPASAGPLKQYLVVRDGMGGVAFATWDICAQ